MSGRVIYPTHTCFDDALDLLATLVTADQALAEQLWLVHGICLAPDDTPYAHAWVETPQACLTKGILDGAPFFYEVERATFYTAMRVQERTRYSVRHAVLINRRTGTYGRWLPTYRRLCAPNTSEAPRIDDTARAAGRDRSSPRPDRAV